jgi:dihydrodipicolinate synthase/N-acetylneuraminate lyase
VFIQTSGGAKDLAPPVELIVQLAREFPHLAYVKEESAPLVERMKAELAQRPAMKAVFGAALGDGWLYEMRLGLDGVMTGMAMYADLMARMWDLRERGRLEEVRDAYSKFLLMRNVNHSIPGADLFVMQKRGVFKSTTTRTGGAAAWKPKPLTLAPDAVAEIEYRFAALKPYLSVSAVS